MNADQMATLQEAAADYIFANADTIRVSEAASIRRRFIAGLTAEPYEGGSFTSRFERALGKAYRAGADLARRQVSRENIGRVIAWEHYGIAWEHLERQSRADILAMVDRMLALAAQPPEQFAGMFDGPMGVVNRYDAPRCTCGLSARYQSAIYHEPPCAMAPPVEPPKETRQEAEARIMQDWRWGNLTRLGVANHLRRAGWKSHVASDKANALEPRMEGDTWGRAWQREGYNGAFTQAIAALRYLADNDRPSGGEQFPNSASCHMVADDLERTRKRYEALCATGD